MKGFCVPPELVRKVWPSVMELIRTAMKRGGLGSFMTVQADLLAGKLLLWLVRDDNTIKAALVTALEQTEWHKSCVIVACGGEDAPEWISLIGLIEDYAKAEGCGSVRIYGREGWLGLLPDNYRVHRVVIERAL